MKDGAEGLDGRNLCISGRRRGAGDSGVDGMERMQEFVLREGELVGRP